MKIKRLKNKFVSAVVLASALMLFGCGQKAAQTEAQAEAQTEAQTEIQTEAHEDVYIVYTNDVHSYLYNTVTVDEEEVAGMRFSKIAALVQDMRAEGKNVLLVDAGDEIQGDVYGAFDEGESVIELMNAAGYQLATIGNHEFDYGINRMFQRTGEANYPYITCNFHSLVGDQDPFPATHIFEIGECKVAFVGITTPDAISSSTPAYFQNEAGEYIYTVDGINDCKDMYASVQSSIDAVREEADYVIALAHVGVGLEAVKWGISSYDVIANVTGLDAYIDGHSHTTLEQELVADKDGKEVLLTQTGCYLTNVGVLELTSEGISAKLISEYDNQDAEVAALEDAVNDDLQALMGEKIGTLETGLYINNPDDAQVRYIRSREMNAGDFVADSVYWFFNNKLELNCDIAIINGGGVRAQLDAGDITYMDAKSIQPFGNMICLIEASGQQILDALEMGVVSVGGWDDQWNMPAEHGGFLQVAGMKYTIDATIPSSVKTMDDEAFVSVDGDYRVKDVMVYNRQSMQYEPLELDKTYMLGGINYLLRNGGGGLNMFSDCEMVIDYVGQDYVIMSEYIKNFATEDGRVLINSKNSPLSSLNGYLMDYENPYGAGRIDIMLE